MPMRFGEEVNSFNAELHSMRFFVCLFCTGSVYRALRQFLLGECSDDALFWTESFDALSGYGDPSYP
jgi:hypothetical protein